MSTEWQTFQRINEERRAVRHFTGAEVSDDDMKAILAAAQLAPSSRNSQPYEFHWVRDPLVRQEMARACNGQRAAQTAGAFVVVVSNWRSIRSTSESLLRTVEADARYGEGAKGYHRKQAKELRWFLRIMSLRLVGALRLLLSTISPLLSLTPAGPGGLHHWAARSSIFAAQTLLLAATARGLASCPMEGFNPLKVSRVLGLRRGEVISLVIALGTRADDARVEPRWRRPFEDAVVVH
jgi:nitroreductase